MCSGFEQRYRHRRRWEAFPLTCGTRRSSRPQHIPLAHRLNSLSLCSWLMSALSSLSSLRSCRHSALSPASVSHQQGLIMGSYFVLFWSPGEIPKGSAMHSSPVTLAFQEPYKTRSHSKQQEGWACPPFAQLPVC